VQWLNEPPAWSDEDNVLTVTTGEKSDFWQKTFYGSQTNNGHLYYQARSGDFTAEVTFSADYSAHYDQAGLMVRWDDDLWVKAGVEHAHGVTTLSAVYTRHRSDWCLGPVIGPHDTIRLRLTRVGGSVCTQWARPDGEWSTLRLGFVCEAPQAQVGPLACTPMRAGLTARFWNFAVTPPVDLAGSV
jgi:hypothetical protein